MYKLQILMTRGTFIYMGSVHALIFRSAEQDQVLARHIQKQSAVSVLGLVWAILYSANSIFRSSCCSVTVAWDWFIGDLEANCQAIAGQDQTIKGPNLIVLLPMPWGCVNQPCA